ncbi:MAG: hypothetical protein WBB32_15035 [Flavobacteriales bacterium]|nr:hypothetical protein [Flavobacteriales bacterium]
MAKKASQPKKAAKKKDTVTSDLYRNGMDAMHDLQKLLAKQDFKSEADINAFFEKFMAEPIPEFEPETDAEKAEELAMSAYSLPPAKGRKVVEQALDMDPECMVALEYLGDMEEHPSIAIAFYDRVVTIGEERFFLDPEDVEKYTGRCWGFHETRPYMRCFQKLADRLYFTGRLDGSIAIWDHLLMLNPMDNQGVRYPLSLFMAVTHPERFREIDKQFDEEESAFMRFNRTLASFVSVGPGPATTKLLKQAMAENRHIVPMLLAPEEPKEIASNYSPGSYEEALVYCHYGWVAWMYAADAKEWLRNV